MKSKASILGHPLHPAMVAVPIGMLTSALLLDAIAVYAEPTNWMPAAATLTIVGTVLLALSAIPGFIDYRNVVPKDGPVRRLANRHMGFGLLLAGLYIASSVLHGIAWRGADPALVMGAFWLNLVGVAGLTIQGWMGSALVYKGHVAVLEGEPLKGRREARREARREHRKAPART